MNNKIKILTTKEFKELQILENFENVINFTKNMLDANHVIIWFEDSDRKSFWSFRNENKISLAKDDIDFILKEESIYIERDSHISFIEMMEALSNYSKKIENIMFYKIYDEMNNHIILIEIINIKNRESIFPNSNQDILKLISTLLVQTVNMKGVSSLAKYYFEEQEKAYIKQKAVLQNDLENSTIFDVDIFHKPSDILNGDSYSIYKTLNGDILVYVLDAMGHGIGPSLTAYSISAIIQQKIKISLTFQDLMEAILDNVQYILTDEEQLTCGFFWFSQDLLKVEYVVAGMYAPMILDDNQIITAKANNIPFMNFAFDFSITAIELKNFQKFLIFTDGLVEDTQELNISLDNMLQSDKYSSHIYQELSKISLDDDTTIIKITKKDL